MTAKATVKLNIDGKEVEVARGTSVLQAALDAGIYIPHLCHHPDLEPIGACGLCIVDIEGIEGHPTSCTTPAEDGMKVSTKTAATEKIRRLALELMLAGHPADCGSCEKYLNCELQSLKQYLGCEELSVRKRSRLLPINTGNPLFVHDPNKCVVCGRCVRACRELRGVGVLFYQKKGRETLTGTAADLPLAEAGCRFCGACAEVCPTGAIQDKEESARGKNRKTILIPCRYSCPAEIDVPRYVRLVKEGNYSAAAAVIREKVPLPGVLGYVCDHVCEDKCRRGEVNEAVTIRELKRFASEHDEQRIWEKDSEKKPATDKKIAIIGSGPAGLTAAYYLVNQEHAVTVFEALPQAGGMMRYGIPEYRLPKQVLDSEINDIVNRGVGIKTDTRIESLDALFQEGFDAVLVTIGTPQGQKLPVPGADNEGVLIGVDFLREVNTGNKVKIGDKVLVLGGGNVAFDCARVARRLGAGQVSLACIECREEMPATDDEISQGEEEGINVYPASNVKRIMSRDGRITGAEFLDVAECSFDEDKNLHIEEIENTEHIIEADTVIFAIGQRPEVPPGYEIETRPNSLITVDEYSYSTDREGVFAAGDAVSGTSSVIKAIASGRKAAAAIDRFLGGNGIIDEKFVAATEPERCLGYEEGFAFIKRGENKNIRVEERLKGFCKVVADMDEEAATYEAGRCLQCDLRLKITSVKFWGSY
jgi:NADPH-dependent glutamate synthase beta subunit-like oxidoreductase/ferredoxin